MTDAIIWSIIPDVVSSGAPYDGEDVLLYVYTDQVHHVRLGRWGWGDDAFADLRPKGWWTPSGPISEEELAGELRPTHWAPFNPPPRWMSGWDRSSVVRAAQPA